MNPLLKDLLAPMGHYWVTSQAEYSTDIVFKSRRHLEELVPRLLEHSTLQFEATDILTFLSRKLSGQFAGEVVTYQGDRLIGGRHAGTARQASDEAGLAEDV